MFPVGKTRREFEVRLVNTQIFVVLFGLFGLFLYVVELARVLAVGENEAEELGSEKHGHVFYEEVAVFPGQKHQVKIVL